MNKKYMQGWRDAGWTILILAIAISVLIWAADTYGQVQTQHLSVIAKKNSGSSPPASTNILEDSSFVYGNWNAANAVWWSGTWTYNSGSDSYSYSGSGTASLIQEPTYGSSWSIDADDYEVGFEIANAGSDMALRMDLFTPGNGNIDNILGNNYTFYSYGNGVHWVDFTLSTNAYEKIMIIAGGTGSSGDILWIQIRPK